MASRLISVRMRKFPNLETNTKTGKSFHNRKISCLRMREFPILEVVTRIGNLFQIWACASTCGTAHSDSQGPGQALHRPILPRKQTFEVQPIHQYNKKFPFFRQPYEIGCFSQVHDNEKGERIYRDDSSQLKFFCPPPNRNVSFDLRDGYEVFNSNRVETDHSSINDLLKWISKHRDKFTIPQQKCLERNLSTDFVCWRGLLTKLLCTPYENREGWKIAVIRFKHTHYMCEFDTDEKLRQQKNETPKQKEMSYWGYKFEKYLVSETERGSSCVETPVKNNEGYGSVVRGRLNAHSLVFAGEVDCMEMVNGRRKYIELKTSREIDHPRQQVNFKRFKLIKWWAQSFLIGIEKIICGFRDDDGIVHRLESFSTSQLPKYCSDIARCWEPNICFNFLERFLEYVKDCVQVDDPRTAYLFEWKPSEPIQCSQMPKDSSYCFLPTWYIDLMEETETEVHSTCSKE